VTGTSTTLTLAASDPAGGTLSYAWTVTNGSGSILTGSTAPTIVHATGNNWTVTFHQAGSYNFQVQVTSSRSGESTTSARVAVTIVQTFTSIKVTSATSSVRHGTTTQLQLLAQALDQFLIAMTTQPTFSWSVSGPGTVTTGTPSSTGLYKAPTTGTGTAIVTAKTGTKSGTATVTVT